MREIARVVCEFRLDRIPSDLGRDMLKNGFIALCFFSIAAVSPCLAQTRLEGQVLSPTPCHLYDKARAEVCTQVVVGVEGAIKFHRIGVRKARSVTVSVDKNGDFSARLLQRGRYKVSFDAGAVNSDGLQISPPVITVRGRKVAQAELFLVAHKSYGEIPAAAISSECGIE